MQKAVFSELMKNLKIPCSVTLPLVTYSEVTLSSEPSFFSILAELFQKIPSTKISQIVYPSLETLSKVVFDGSMMSLPPAPSSPMMTVSIAIVAITVISFFVKVPVLSEQM